MTTSATTTFDLPISELCEEAWERAGSEIRSGYDYRTTRRSLNLLLADWCSRGINMWAIDSGTIALITGTATYNLPTDTVDLLEHVIRTGSGSVSTQADLSITRISVSTYATIPNKLTMGRPIQLLVNRLSPTPTITVWPIPDGSTSYVLAYWRLRRLQDATSPATQTTDVPYRFLPALVAGLAYYIAMKIPEGQPRLQYLKQVYDETWEVASTEDREKASVRFVPKVGYV